MFREFLGFGTVPVMEDCVSVTRNGEYREAMLTECKRFKAQLLNQFGPEPEGAYITIKSFPHDFGSYYEVGCVFEVENEVACEYAYNIESNLPEYWEEVVKEAV